MLNDQKYGIAYTQHGGIPPHDPIIGWKQENGIDITWNTYTEALEGCEFDGWRGYVCVYPSGRRLSREEANKILDKTT